MQEVTYTMVLLDNGRELRRSSTGGWTERKKGATITWLQVSEPERYVFEKWFQAFGRHDSSMV